MNWGLILLKGMVWVLLMMIAAYLLGVEWNMRVCALCILGGLLDSAIDGARKEPAK